MDAAVGILRSCGSLPGSLLQRRLATTHYDDVRAAKRQSGKGWLRRLLGADARVKLTAGDGGCDEPCYGVAGAAHESTPAVTGPQPVGTHSPVDRPSSPSRPEETGR